MRKEPHIYVPYGGVFRNYYWYLLWALLGVRSEWQRGWSAAKTAQNNVEFAHRYVNYLRLETILGTARKHYSHAEVDPSLWELRVPGRRTFWASFLHAPVLHKPAAWWYRRFCTLVLFLIK